METIRFEVFEATAAESRLRCFGGDGKLLGERPLPAAEVAALVSEVEAGYSAAAPDLLGLGRRLYDWLDGPTERWLARARQRPGGLVVEVDVSERLRHLPWELLAEGSTFLATALPSPLLPVRRIRGAVAPGPLANRPLRLLFLAASPEGVEPVLAYEVEEAQILEATRSSPLELEVEESGSLEGLGQRLGAFGDGYFDALHLTGHATVKEGQPLFLLESDVGTLAPASPGELAKLFAGGWPSLLFLSGCRTGEAPGKGALPSFAEQLVAAGAPAVLGWALPVGDRAATVAGAELYHALATGKTLAEGLARARAELLHQRSPYWHLLRCYGAGASLTARVTPLNARNRQPFTARPMVQVFLDSGSQVEVCPRERFVGRRREIQRCLKVLRAPAMDPSYREGVLLHGMGGLGKSSLAVRLAERLAGTHERCVWVGKLDEVELLGRLSESLTTPEATQALNQPGLSLKARLRNLVRDHLAAKPMLFVLDDFEQNVEKAEDGAPKEDPEGRAVLQPEAREVLGSLLSALREAGSSSRVIVTCRYRFAVAGPASLWEETPPTLQSADLEKKRSQLLALSPQAKTDPKLVERALALAAGNPRLLERLDQVLGAQPEGAEDLFAQLEGTAQQFREQVLLAALLARQAPEGRKLLALLQLFQLPADRPTVEATAGELPTEPHLGRALALGLAERSPEPAGQGERFFVSAVLEPLLVGEASEEELAEAAGRAARHLTPLWWEGSSGTPEPQALELHRLALRARELKLAADVADRVATHWISRSRFREAARLCEVTLQAGEEHRLLHTLARAEQALGQTAAAAAHFERSAEVSSLHVAEASPEELREHAALLANQAVLHAQQGRVEEAFELFRQSLEINEQIGDVQGEAATLHQMAGLHAQQGRVEAFELYRSSRSKRESATFRARPPRCWDGGLHAQQGRLGGFRALPSISRDLRADRQRRGQAATLHALAVLHAVAAGSGGGGFRALPSISRDQRADRRRWGPGRHAACAGGSPRAAGSVGGGFRALPSISRDEGEIGDVQGQAATLHQMAVLHGQQGRLEAAELYRQFSRLTSRIGDAGARPPRCMGWRVSTRSRVGWRG
ncbi:MAG: CHAT domain-containing protein [Thermoanaerobaculia bacterium]